MASHHHADDTEANVPITANKVFIGEQDDHDYEASCHKRLWLPLAKRLKRDICLRVPHGRRREPVRNNNFYVWYYSTPVESETHTCSTHFRDEMWGIASTCYDGFHDRCWLGAYPIVTPEGNEIGALDKDNLYIYWDACHTRDGRELEIIKKIVEYAISVFDNPRGFNRNDSSIDLLSDEKIAKLVEQVTTVYKSRLSSTEEHIEEMMHNLTDIRKRIVSYLQALDTKMIEMQAIEEVLKTTDDRLKKAVMAIKSIPDVQSVKIVGDQVIVMTKNIVANGTHDIGCLKMIFNISDECAIKIVNTTRRVTQVNGYIYPTPWSTNESGGVNWGALSDASTVWSAKLELENMMIGLLRLIKTPGDTTVVERLSCWPEVGGPKTEFESVPNEVPFKAIEIDEVPAPA